MGQELVGTGEIAVMFGVSRQRVYQLTSREEFPRPVAELMQGNVWKYTDVIEYARETGRTVRPLT